MSTATRIGVLIVAYNAERTLGSVLDRIPEDFRSRITEVIVSDDFSHDATMEVALRYQETSDLPITLVRQPRNLGYGGNQKAGYRLAIEHQLDVIVLLHGDGQYAPEEIGRLVEPIISEDADAVFGSRMMVKGNALKGGMPLYKYLGNRVLTKFENKVLGTSLSEFHSGYRAYRVQTLAELPFEKNSDGFDFDTEIIIQLHDADRTIRELPIPTYYGDEICYVDGLSYAGAVARDVVAYRLHKMGFGDGSRVALQEAYDFKGSPESSHGRVLERLRDLEPGKVLDLGCSGGLLDEKLQRYGYSVTGVDYNEIDGVRDRLNDFYQADLNEGIPDVVGIDFDVLLACDVLEHLVKPEQLLVDGRQRMKATGIALICVPNISHWYSRFRVFFGIFGYDQRGILDASHLRFFTRRSIRRLVENAGFSVSSFEPVGLPLDAIGVQKASRRGILWIEKVLLKVWPTMFAYQWILEATPDRRKAQ
jgi:glycosyltransferase involved in cell wall biosynthesis